jgi:hypothetical protein
MNCYFILLSTVILLFTSCKSRQKEQLNFSEEIKGNWLILYPDHDLANNEQRKLYVKARDSIVALLGLKTISFRGDGLFVQTDSLFSSPGKWNVNAENNNLFIRNGGKGLDFFAGKISSLWIDTLQVVEHIVLSGQKIKLTWFLKHIHGKKYAALFNEEGNWWRKVNGDETEPEIKRRIKAMLQYYALYYELVSNESAYFSQSRVFLPFKYYQHSIGLRPFDAKSDFSRLFNNATRAEKGYAVLKAAMDKLKNQRFPTGKDFVIEYAMYMSKLAEAIE